MALSAKEAKIIKDGWEIVLMPRYEARAMEFFLGLFAKEPAIMDRFTFIKDLGPNERLDENPRLQKHASIALLLVGDAVASFGDPESAEQVMKRVQLLGRLHVKFGAKEQYFRVVKDALFDMLRKAFRSLWNSEMETAWGKAIDVVVGEMVSGLKAGYAKEALKEAQAQVQPP